MSKTTTLSAEQWKALCLLNVTQLHNFLQSVPGYLEGGSPGMNAERMGAIGVHLEELGRFMGAWSKAKLPEAVAAPPSTASAEASEQEATAPRRRGRPRKVVEAQAEH